MITICRDRVWDALRWILAVAFAGAIAGCGGGGDGSTSGLAARGQSPAGPTAMALPPVGDVARSKALAVATSVALAPFKSGDLFVSIGGGKVQHRTPAGELIETLDTLQGGFTTGMAFDAEGSLYVTTFGAGSVVRFNNLGERLGIFGGGYSGSPESIIFDRSGNAYVGSVNGDNDVRKFNAQGNQVDQFNVALDRRGSDWIDLAADQCTLFYTSEGASVKRFDLCNNTQLSNFNVAPLPDSVAFAFRLRPGKDVLVANSSVITRLDSAGNLIRTYDAPGQNCWFALNLDRDGTSFWSADFCTANVYKFDIETGQILSTFNTGSGSMTVFGLVVYGEVTAAAPPPTPSVRQVQQRPAIQAIQSVPGTGAIFTPITKHNAVVLTHGWNSDVNAWPKPMAEQIRTIIDDRQQQGFFRNEQWDVVYVDWSESASPCPGSLLHVCKPWDAYANARLIGIKLADYLAPTHYDHIHFIAHSAGSNVIETASSELKKRATTKQPYIHETFLDAYAPWLSVQAGVISYGQSANWAEQYVDTRDSVLLYSTNLDWPDAYNFDVSKLDPDQLHLGLIAVIDQAVAFHAWPYIWYAKTVDSPSAWNYGVRLATEYSTIKPPGINIFGHSILGRSGKCILTSASTTCGDELVALRSEIQTLPTHSSWGSGNSIKATWSTTGSVTISSLNLLHLILATGSPVWVSLVDDVPESFNTLQFNYKFISNAEGLLSVFMDDQVVFKADELQAQAGFNPSGRISVGNVGPGQHTLSFRLDHLSTTQSSVEISDVTTSMSSIIRAVNQKPIASAGVNQIVRLGSLAQLDGSSSSDPDQKPLPLTFNWSQVSGPTTLLFDSTTATPKFTPSTKGAYLFSLVVNDGQSNSDPASVTVTVPILGDIDVDGDVDGIDISLVARAVGKKASGPNDLRDINGDGRIDALDVSALAKMCTRAGCAAK